MNKSYTKTTFKIYWRHLKKYRWLFWLSVLSVLLGSGSFVAAPLYYKKFFDILTLDLPSALKADWLIDVLWKLLLVYILGWVGWRGVTYSANVWQAKGIADLYQTCFDYLHRHSVSFFHNNFVGSLVKKVNRFPGSFVGLTDLMVFEVLPLILNTLFVIIVLTVKHWQLGLGIIAWVILYVLLNYWFSLYKLKFDLRRSEADSKITGYLADTITNQQNIKLFGGYQKENAGFKDIVEVWRRLRKFTWDISSHFESFQGLSMFLTELAVFYVAIRLWQKGLVTIGDFVLLQVYLINIFHRFWDFGRLVRRYYELVADANEMTEILETPHQITNTLTAKPLQVLSGAITFKDVIFSYTGAGKVFNKFNLEILPHERVALVGPSGAGKSTVIHLLLRNYDLDGGSIKIDNQKIGQATLESLRENIALVPQDPILFHRSLLENIRYGRHSASDGEVLEAAKLAHAHEFIEQFPEGYETLVGERGVKLSGGERQRIAIARAILKNAPILILDEATSSLDSESEHVIQEALDRLMKEKTVIVIAHRLSTIMKADRVIVLANGQIAEQGSHAELLKQTGGLYSRLWQRQVCGFIK